MTIADAAISSAPPGVVDIWRVPLDVDPEPFECWLDASDRQRATRRLGRERERFVVAHGALCKVASRYTDARVTALYGEPPRCEGIELSLSHADDLAVIAVATAPVGIDVESTGAIPADEVEDIAEFVLSRDE